MVHVSFKKAGKFTDLIKEVFKDDEEKLFIVGGDGTFTYALKSFPFGKIPLIFGFKNGTINFLLHFEIKEDKKYLESFKNTNFKTIEKHRLLIKSHNILISNELTLRSKDFQLNSFTIFINDCSYVSFRASELIVSTRQGSTAYNFSVGGPVIFTDAIVINAVAPNRCNFRPLVLSLDQKILIATTRCSGFADGTEIDGDVFDIVRGDSYKVAVPESYDEFESIKSLFFIKK